MKKLLSTLLLSALPFTGWAQVVQSGDWFDDMAKDADRYYTRDRLTRLGVAMGMGAVVANTNADQSLQNSIQGGRSSGTDSFSTSVKQFGEWKYMLPISWGISALLPKDNGGLQTWGNLSLRAIVVGTPSTLIGQRVAGASRPNEEGVAVPDSKWRPLKDDNSVSGHSFVGAIPFLAMAELNNQSIGLKALGYAASFAVPFSRMNDNDHYPSQAALGWFMAYESVQTVIEGGQRKATALRLVPIQMAHGQLGLGLQKSW